MPLIDNPVKIKSEPLTSTASFSGTASSITVVPTGSVSSTNVQAAIAELDTEKLSKTGGTLTGMITASNPAGLDLTSGVPGQTNVIEIFQQTAGADALISFHVAHDIGGYFGLDGGLNDFVIGGWTFGATTAHRVWHEGNNVRHRSFTVSTVPSASSSGAGTMIYVSNASGGAVPAFSDGTSWRRVTDRTVIS